ncbi:CTTNBP2 N-terminal-like protein isoform X2 [Octopus sinensis]|uniref:CTTNBP2 N-terminal-like protein isoform X2 n=1 Tax=Octopus sinensis TaxID=2607531 RepID=A0A6P7TPU4_9MOLL|nr:CTTNBP2 N-terminal-like protein isoform X2 [Octopus sinensis]
MDLNKTDLLRLLSYLEGELQARDVVIATLKAEKAKQLLYQAKYGRFGLGDPFVALQRDSDNMKDHSFDEAAIKCMYDNQLAQLENLIATQRRAQLKMREQLAQVEKRYHKVLSELEEEKQKHAQDTAQGDDVTYMLEKERERLKQEVEFEKNQSRRMEKDLKKTLANLEEERENSAKHKQVALMLIRERRKLVERILQEKRKCNEMEHIMNDEKDKMMSMAEGLVQESKKSLKIEAAMEKQLSDFDTEREQLRGRVSREESKNKELREQVEQLHRELQQARSGVGGALSSGSSNSSSQLSFISAGDDGVTDPTTVGGDDDGSFLGESGQSVSSAGDGNVQHSETINLAVGGCEAEVCLAPVAAIDATHEQNVECTIPLSSLSSGSPSAKVAPHHSTNPVTIDSTATLQISSSASTSSSSSSASPSTALYTSSCYSSSPPTRPPPPPSSSPPPPPQFYTASAVAEGRKPVVQLNSNSSSSHAHPLHMESRPMSPGEIFSPASDIRIVSGVGADGSGGSRISVSAAGGATVLSTSGGGRISFQFGQPTSGHPSPPSSSAGAGAGHARKAVTIGRGTPPPVPPNKPVLIACSGGGGGSGGSGGGSTGGTSVVVGVKPAVPPKVGITVSKDRLFLSSSESDNTVVLSSSSSSSSSSSLSPSSSLLSSSRTPANKPLQIPVSVVTNQSHIASNRTSSSSSSSSSSSTPSSLSSSSSSSSSNTAVTANNANRENSPMRKTTQVCVNGK